MYTHPHTQSKQNQKKKKEREREQERENTKYNSHSIGQSEWYVLQNGHAQNHRLIISEL